LAGLFNLKMVEVKILVEGKHEFKDDKLEIGSTVSLIKTDKNIIVDTGSFLDKDKIISGLKEENLTCDDIDIVILTHLHLDHLVNTYLFKNAKIFCKFTGGGYSGQFHTPSEGCLQGAEIFDNAKIAEDVEFLLTPGHTVDMISVLVKTDKGNIVVCGDAMPSKNFIDMEKKPIVNLIYNLELFDESRKKILDVADYIIPGHGGLIKIK